MTKGKPQSSNLEAFSQAVSNILGTKTRSVSASRQLDKAIEKERAERRALLKKRAERRAERRRGHVPPPRYGSASSRSAALATQWDIPYERQLRRVATKGAVHLFNAISKHKAQVEETVESVKTSTEKEKVTKLSKDSFLDLLKNVAKDKPAPGSLSNAAKAQLELPKAGSLSLPSLCA
ncbi:hypothetical protein H696_00195 [Fonticula alba]|uniref:RRP15-like protein n=1 Tax=Fonticula alba TaxID=691883 RepID=A0A058ZF79_FONAL|nr:hypothetical protein H696_00195 [Fonticula alba]KCV72611.1 hypothetical protein H696_00195 [Fonticula alba]|eukprot:XP_009492312.1 hypothetical protein H696_00195 [Fonticula alba]